MVHRQPPGQAPKSAMPPRVSVVRGEHNEADEAATRALIEAYSDKDGFHCPRCHATITNADDAIEHIGQEINEALGQFEARQPTESKGAK